MRGENDNFSNCFIYIRRLRFVRRRRRRGDKWLCTSARDGYVIIEICFYLLRAMRRIIYLQQRIKYSFCTFIYISKEKFNMSKGYLHYIWGSLVEKNAILGQWWYSKNFPKRLFRIDFFCPFISDTYNTRMQTNFHI